MHPNESSVDPRSDYFIYVPGNLARKLYLYPLTAGEFFYRPGYHISRSSFDSFLIMYISEGSCDIVADGEKYHASAGQTVFLDCYRPHSYGHENAWSALWLHFDGILAPSYFQEITRQKGPVLSAGSAAVSAVLQGICRDFRHGKPVSESGISRQITDMLDTLLLPDSCSAKEQAPAACADTITQTIAYINDHFGDPVSLGELAKLAGFSPFHFTRIFSRFTGMTPHQYLIRTRISAAKYLLKSSALSIREIAFSTGFSSESSFCTTFKKWEGITPSLYRNPKLSS